MTRRVLLLGVALAIALVGVALLYLYLRGAEQRALEAREVWVTREGVAAGTPVADLQEGALVELASVPGSAILPGALGPADDLTGEALVGVVTQQPLLPGEQLVEAKLGPTSDTANVIAGRDGTADGPDGEPTDLLLGSFQFADPERVAGFLQPNSRVAVFYTFTATGSPDTPQATVTRVLLPEVEVAAVGSLTGRSPVASAEAQRQGAQVPEALVTLRVTAEQMATLVTARSTGSLYLGLLPDGTTVEDVAVDSTDLTGGAATGAGRPPGEGVSP